MKPPKEEYDKIPTKENLGAINVPGCYCATCGKTFALYSFSHIVPVCLDDEGKLYYERCEACPIDDKYLEKIFSDEEFSKIYPDAAKKLFVGAMRVTAGINNCGLPEYQKKENLRKLSLLLTSIWIDAKKELKKNPRKGEGHGLRTTDG